MAPRAPTRDNAKPGRLTTAQGHLRRARAPPPTPYANPISIGLTSSSAARSRLVWCWTARFTFTANVIAVFSGEDIELFYLRIFANHNPVMAQMIQRQQRCLRRIYRASCDGFSTQIRDDADGTVSAHHHYRSKILIRVAHG